MDLLTADTLIPETEAYELRFSLDLGPLLLVPSECVDEDGTLMMRFVVRER